jgi:hypothetical protein
LLPLQWLTEPEHLREQCKMLGLLLDAVALIAIVMFVNENNQVEFIKALLVALAISLVCGFAGSLLAGLGMVGYLVRVVPQAALAGLVIWLALGMTLQRSMIAGAVFLVYKIAIGLVL